MLVIEIQSIEWSSYVQTLQSIMVVLQGEVTWLKCDICDRVYLLKKLLCLFRTAIKLKKLYGPFLWMGFNCFKAPSDFLTQDPQIGNPAPYPPRHRSMLTFSYSFTCVKSHEKSTKTIYHRKSQRFLFLIHPIFHIDT